jgi:Glycosyltransferase family 87
VVVFMACGIAAIPAWMAIDRGNSTGFVVPVALVFLVALCRRRWGLVTIMVVLAALVKPQFVVLAVALFAARRWRLGGVAVAGAVISNIAAYALWPRDFPQTITQSTHNILGYNNGTFQALVVNSNVSFAKAFLLVPDGIKASQAGGRVPDGFLAGPRSLIGYVVLVLVVVFVLALGRRIPPVMAGIVLLATACLFPALSQPYYLVFVLPVAALVARDPDGPPGSGIFDRLAAVGGRRRAVGICVSLAVALSIAQIALPGPPVQVGDITGQMGAIGTATRLAVVTTVCLAPLLWLVTCGAIIVSYARRPALSHLSVQGPAREDPADTAVSTSSRPELITEFSPQ